MSPTSTEMVHTMAWLSLVGLVFLVLTALTLGCLWIGERFPMGRIAAVLFGRHQETASGWRAEDDTKDRRIQEAIHGVAHPTPFDRANLAASHRASVTPIAVGRRR